MNEDREVLPEIPGLYGDQKEKYGNFELKIIYKSISEKEMSKLIKISLPPLGANPRFKINKKCFRNIHAPHGAKFKISTY